MIDQMRSTHEYSLVITEVSQVAKQTATKTQKLISKLDILTFTSSDFIG